MGHFERIISAYLPWMISLIFFIPSFEEKKTGELPMDEESLYLWLNKKNEMNVSEIWALLSIFSC